MAIGPYHAADLFEWLTGQPDFLLLDVRNDVEFGRFKVEGPYPFDMQNVPYMEFIEHEEESVAKVPRDRKIRIVCAKEGSAKYVGEILENHGYADIKYLTKGIKSWGNLLAPVRVDQGSAYELYQFRRPGKASCSYGLIFNSEMMIFDPAKNIDRYIQFSKSHGCQITHTIETHLQADYISGSWALQKGVGATIMAPENDFSVARFDYTAVNNRETIFFSKGGPGVTALSTPGHTPGSTCYLIDGKYLISGDTVFLLSIGRPDLGGMVKEWSRMLFQTMTDIIIPMDENVVVLPGHYMDWKEADKKLLFQNSLGKVKETNSEIYTIEDEIQFYHFIRDNMRTQPEEYAKIREINAGLVAVNLEEQDILDLGKNECAASMMHANG